MALLFIAIATFALGVWSAPSPQPDESAMHYVFYGEATAGEIIASIVCSFCIVALFIMSKVEA